MPNQSFSSPKIVSGPTPDSNGPSKGKAANRCLADDLIDLLALMVIELEQSQNPS